jgi:hypothetical protein
MDDDMDLMIRRADPERDPGAPGPEPLAPHDFWQRMMDRRDRQRRRRRARTLAVVGVVAVVCGTPVGVVMGSLPADGPASSAAAAQLRTIAAHAVAPVNMPANGSWLQRTLAFSITSPSSDATTSATVTGTMSTWASGTKSCQKVTFQPVQFSSPARSTSWQAAGLSASPIASGGPHGYCTTAAPTDYAQTHPSSVLSNGILPIDVSTLTSNPAMLADELAAGTTGIPSLDTVTSSPTGDPSQNPISSTEVPFARAALLLLAPVTGTWPGFRSVVYQALSLLPHVSALGTTTTHTGATGQGFAASTHPNAVAIVVDGSGNLLEVRHFPDWIVVWAELVATAFSPPGSTAKMFTPPLVSQLPFATGWIDPVGTPAVVTTSAIPPLRDTYAF